MRQINDFENENICKPKTMYIYAPEQASWLQDMQWFKTRNNNGKTEVFDPLRRKYVALTPEEEVRQITLHHLVNSLHIPPGLIAVEYAIKLNSLARRCDAVVFDTTASPLMIVECKAKEVPLTQAVLDQIIRYNMVLKVRYLLITNAVSSHMVQMSSENNIPEFIDYLPSWKQLTDPPNTHP